MARVKNKSLQQVSSFSKGRYILTIVLIIAGLVALIARAAYVQLINADFYIAEGNKRSLRTEQIPYIRGDILDRNGELLSVSVENYSIIADPKEIFEKNSLMEKERWQRLAETLNVPLSDVINRLNKNPKSRFVYLDRQISPTMAKYIHDLKITGISMRKEYRRFYPTVEESAQLLGYTNIDGQGIEGIEKSFDSLLIGKSGSKTYRRDKSGNIIENISSTQKYDAHDVTLSIDRHLQSMVFREIKKAVAENKAESGTAVLVKISTGEILAMATAPSYNPNSIFGSQAELRRNRAITDTFEPGSTVKPFVVLTALTQKIISPDTVINTKPFVVNGHTIRDVAPRNELSITGILQKSSNVGVSRLSLQMPISVLMNTYHKAGFGMPTNLGLVGEQSGTLPLNRKRWADIERATVAYGYGLTVTPLQLARAYVALGSFGVYRPLSITKVDPPVIGERIYSEKVTREVVHMMESVAQPGGGGIAAAVPGYRVAIKTGTAKKLENGQYVDKYIAYTAGIAPASDPQFALVILINNPTAGKYYGGAISAPVFSKIMGHTLRAKNITPDGIEGEVKSAKRVVRIDTLKSENQRDN
ncbi:peptidoglycan synthase [Gallibacterium salpingitidis]|uniref:Peptidoglycan D,D-transpeptidase FtsI n=1 Tax=Gallibacterium salpingitidis TaxID=505341 RepID=A0AB36E226_9PAST|nr:peptidoglycan glycosyltransferase FtsI [Gallibacterium salpingitidis]OBX09015.1 peptidoglycan synthase [Gallibacterium salpingitidis]OBX10135.1 peptidoglycan synthase [Gallibacterium salpingitidis]WKS98689.1 peptidoglycan glycosyltransferase FtsI [Gallibacterium salpingitidis]